MDRRGPKILTTWRRAPGMTLVYTSAVIFALVGFLSLSVDYGRVQHAKTELQAAVDAAARYAVTGIADNTYLTKAQTAAAQNTIDGTTLVLTQADVEIGQWNTTNRIFTVGGGGTPNAVRVTGRRIASRGTAIPLVFANLIGKSQFDLSVSTIVAQESSAVSYGWIGTGWNNHSGSSGNVIDSYSGTYNAATAGNSGLISNGWLNINGAITVKGNCYYKSGSGVSTNPPAVITGTKTSFSTSIALPSVSLGNIATSINNNLITGSGYSFDGINMHINSGGTVNFPAGNFYVPNLNVNSGGTINYTATGSARATIYCSNFGFSGTQKQSGSTSNMKAANFRMVMYNAGGFNLSGQSDFYGDVYAPQTPLNISGRNFFGRGFFCGINTSGASLHEDTSLPAPYATPTGGPTPGTTTGGSGGNITTMR